MPKPKLSRKAHESGEGGKYTAHPQLHQKPMSAGMAFVAVSLKILSNYVEVTLRAKFFAQKKKAFVHAS